MTRGPVVSCCDRSSSSSPVYFGFGRALARPVAIEVMMVVDESKIACVDCLLEGMNFFQLSMRREVPHMQAAKSGLALSGKLWRTLGR